jgi:hypothetical protein
MERINSLFYSKSTFAHTEQNKMDSRKQDISGISLANFFVFLCFLFYKSIIT